MVILSIFNTVEFYVILAVVAAAIVAAASIPASKGEAKLHLLPCILDSGDAAIPAGLHFRCRDDGSVDVVRTGLQGVGPAGAVSMSVKVIGFDISIEERVTHSDTSHGEFHEACFNMDFLAPEWYHIKFNSEDTGQLCACTLHVRPGLKMSKNML
ncbi:MAG: hypothetical protein K2M79_02675 [Muribaculaceae bacterium]|nr:hypothetical protein [Muribaculaceae bacterium]